MKNKHDKKDGLVLKQALLITYKEWRLASPYVLSDLPEVVIIQVLSSR